MDELTIDGKTYISSKRAAGVTGYAKDYVGQLCREGRVEAKLVGRSWYVYEPSITSHRFNENAATESAGIDIVGASRTEPKSSEKTNIQAVWEVPSYKPEPVEELPLEREEAVELRQAIQEKPSTVSEIEHAWKEWFSAPPKQEEPIYQMTEAAPYEPEEPQGTVEEASVEETKASEEHSVRISHIHSYEEAPMMDIVPPMMSHRAIVRSADPKKSTKKRRTARGVKSNNLIAKALLVGIMLISASIAMIGSGMGGSLGGIFNDEIGFIDFIEGINKAK